MSGFDFDLFVIGAGSGGVRAGRIAAGLGARVAVAEDRYMGGTCVNVGCVPKKLFVYGSHFAEDFEDARGYGWTVGESQFDWPTLRDNKTREIERLNGIYRSMLNNAGVSLLEGRARIVDAHTVEVDGQRYRTERILIATGGWPFVPEIPGKDHVISSNEIFYLETFPKDVLVVGGGYIAVEFAGILSGLGAKTRLLYRGELFLRGFDQEVREVLKEEMNNSHNLELCFNTDVVSIERRDDGRLQVALNSGESLVVDQVLYATGRVPHTHDLGLENVKVELTAKGAIKVDDHFQTSEPSIYAVGDVIDRMQLTPVALAEGMALARYLYDSQPIAMDYDNIATAVFSQPNIGTVGLSEEQALERFGKLRIYTSRFRHMKNTLSGRQGRTFMKLVVDDATDRVVGCHMIGSDAGEIIQGIAIAIKAGATKAIFDSTIGIHPTAAEEFVTLRDITRTVEA
ncbi:glutathione-disulfide reductase [Aestuariirhabdus sp. LZHN29]|uniref:glutathione-disulfide reductase n=1 Tax=Aestuariirhabdus sp. LZHN29 TaxID=3417462 RepID=UPI003CF4BD0A